MQVKVVTVLLSLAWIALLLRWRGSIFGGKTEFFFLMLMKLCGSLLKLFMDWRICPLGRCRSSQWPFIVWFSVGSFVLEVTCFNILAAKIEIVPVFLNFDEICSLLLELFTGLKISNSLFEVATLEVVLAAEEIRWTFFFKEKFVHWINAGQGIDPICDLWRG